MRNLGQRRSLLHIWCRMQIRKNLLGHWLVNDKIQNRTDQWFLVSLAG